MSLKNADTAKIDAVGLVDFCRRLIQTQSYTGTEKAVAEETVQTMGLLGYDSAQIDSFGNAVGIIRGAHPGPMILFDGHVDTVEVSDATRWSVAPFGGEIQDGRIFGRGACDMKCAFAAMVFGLAPLVRLKDRMHGTVVVTGTVCEETFEGLGLSKVIENMDRPDYVIIGEATNLSLKRGQRGRAEICLETFGRAAHSSNPSVGKNAVYMMMDLLAEVRRLPVPEDLLLGQGILELTDIVSVPYPGASVVPHQCRATLDRRLLTGETEETVLAPIRECIDSLRKIDPSFSANVAIVEAKQVCYTGSEMGGKRFFPAWVLSEQNAFVGLALDGLRQVGLDPAIATYSFCTNGSYSAGTAGIPTVGFGPGDEAGAHIVDENMSIDQIQKAAAGYLAIAATVTGLE